MAYYIGLNELRDVLADLYRDEQAARTLVAEAGVAEQQIDFSGPALVFWKQILATAQGNNQVQTLIDVARKRNVKNKRLIEAERIFQEMPVPALPTVADNVDSGGDDGGDSGSGNVTIRIGGDNKAPIAGRDMHGVNVVNAGDIMGNGNVLVAGNENVIQSASSDGEDHGQVIALLKQLLAEIERAHEADELDVDTATDAGYQVKKALNQAEKPDADKKTIIGYLTAAKELLSAVPNLVKLLLAVTDVIEGVKKSF